MSQKRKLVARATSSDNPVRLQSQITAENGVGDQLAANRLFANTGRIRLFTSRAGTSELFREFIGSGRLTPNETGEAGVPEVTLDLILNEDGAIEFALEGDGALVGESLSSLESIADTGESVPDGVDPETDEFLSACEAANEVGVDKSTITRRIKDNRLLGYRGFKRDWLIPRAQFKRGNVVPGIGEMIALFDGDHRETWFFLSSNFFYGDARPRPIDMLRALKHSDEAGLDASLAKLESLKSSYEHGDHF